MINQRQIELTEVLLSLTSKYDTPGFLVTGDGFPETESQYNQMTKFDDNSHKPTWKELVEEYDRLVAENESMKYVFQRAAEYPTIEEQLDTLFHGGLDAWKEQIQAIKDKYPKA
jgi:hypothetical protein